MSRQWHRDATKTSARPSTATSKTLEPYLIFGLGGALFVWVGLHYRHNVCTVVITASQANKENTMNRQPVTMTAETLATRSFKYLATQNPFASNNELKDLSARYMRRMIESGMIIIEN